MFFQDNYNIFRYRFIRRDNLSEICFHRFLARFRWSVSPSWTSGDSGASVSERGRWSPLRVVGWGPWDVQNFQMKWFCFKQTKIGTFEERSRRTSRSISKSGSETWIFGELGESWRGSWQVQWRLYNTCMRPFVGTPRSYQLVNASVASAQHPT